VNRHGTWRPILLAAAALAGMFIGPPRAAAGAPPPPDDQWPRFRGHDGTGVSRAETVPVQWTEADYNWKVELAGTGHASPVVWGNRVFVASGLKDSAKRIVQCLKTEDGSTLWQREFESKPCAQHNLNSYATPTPAVDAERVYLCWAVPQQYAVVALDHDGKDVWRRDLGPFASQHGHGASPMVFGDTVVLANDQNGESFLVALDAATGRTRWQTRRRSGKAAYSTPGVYRPDGEPPQLIFTSTAGGITSVDPGTGKVNWELDDVFPERVVSSPVVAAGLILGTCGTGSAGKHVVAVSPPKGPGGKPEVAYRVTRSAPYVPTPVAWADLVFLWGDTGTVTCIRAATGAEVWRERLGTHFFGSPVCVGGRLYAISTEGKVVVLAAAETYELPAENRLGEGSHATPAVAGGRMYLRTLSHLVSIGGKR